MARSHVDAATLSALRLRLPRPSADERGAPAAEFARATRLATSTGTSSAVYVRPLAAEDELPRAGCPLTLLRTTTTQLSSATACIPRTAPVVRDLSAALEHLSLITVISVEKLKSVKRTSKAGRICTVFDFFGRSTRWRSWAILLFGLFEPRYEVIAASLRPASDELENRRVVAHVVRPAPASPALIFSENRLSGAARRPTLATHLAVYEH